eukprot:2519333-Pyramimonas_sp.AAC.1
MIRSCGGGAPGGDGGDQGGGPPRKGHLDDQKDMLFGSQKTDGGCPFDRGPFLASFAPLPGATS